MDNRTISERLVNYAQYLDAREANIYRMRAYRRAAETVMQLERPVEKIVEEQGRPGLESLPGIGSHLAYTIDQLVRTGEFRTLNPDGGRVDSEYLFASLPGVSLRLAHRIHEELRIDTLEQLEQAAHDGRLAGLGVGPKRLRGIVDALAGRLTRKRVPQPTAGEPSLAELLAVDQEYREQAALGELRTIAQRRFNPLGERWLPLYQTERGGVIYRALYSNTALAHRLGQTNDWVVIYFDTGTMTAQRTIVTEKYGDLRGLRVVRGREPECRAHYAAAGKRMIG